MKFCHLPNCSSMCRAHKSMPIGRLYENLGYDLFGTVEVRLMQGQLFPHKVVVINAIDYADDISPLAEKIEVLFL